ncbi:MAG: sodium:solute symporter family protein [Clostridiales Family XIII bacterium]|jgi:SSS family solute:Na+ symporter|nr:sodium:solute symporter family protein [Clostridiales Family XIII bacterium]
MILDKYLAIPFIMILGYIVITMVLGFLPYGRKRVDTLRDFHTAAASTGSTVVFLCLMASIFTSSTWTVWVSFSVNYGVFTLYCSVYISISALLYFFLSDKVYLVGQASETLTLSGFLMEKYKNAKIRNVSSVISLITVCFWITIEITTLGEIVNFAFSQRLPPLVAVSIGVLVILAYILWGGLESVIWTSCFQGSIITVGGIVLSVMLCSYYFDSFGAFGEALSHHKDLLVVSGYKDNPDANMHLWTSYVVLCGVGAVCLPQVFPRMFMGKNKWVQKKAAVLYSTAALWCIFFVAIGFAALTRDMPYMDSKSQIFTLLYGTGNVYLLGFAYVVFIAASMGTLDISLLSASTLLTVDISENFFKNQNIFFSQGSYIKMSRIIIVIIAVLCTAISLLYNDAVIKLALRSYELVAQLFPALFYACFSKKCDGRAALAGILVACVILVSLTLAGIRPFGFMAGFIALLANALTVLVYIALAKRTKEIPGAA